MAIINNEFEIGDPRRYTPDWKNAYVKEINQVVDRQHKKENDTHTPHIETNIKTFASYMEKDYTHCGESVRSKKTGDVGVILWEFKSGSVRVLQKINKYGGQIVCTYDRLDQLEFIN